MNTTDKTTEIDVSYLLRSIWTKKIVVILTGILFAALSFAYSSLFIDKQYEASTRVYLLNSADSTVKPTAQDLQAGTLLANDYKEFVKSDEVLRQVIEKENLNLTVDKLYQIISVSVIENTRMVSIMVQSKDPKLASQLANTVRDVAAEKFKELSKVENITTIEGAKTPSAPLSPNIKKNTLIGLFAGLFLAVLILMIMELMDTRIKRPEQVEELGIPLLGMVLDFEKM